MFINFNFKGAEHKANVVKYGDNNIEVEVKDDDLGKVYGNSFHYHLINNQVNFTPLNLSYSDLFVLQNTIRNAILQLQLIHKA